jgi:hypothetical protein
MAKRDPRGDVFPIVRERVCVAASVAENQITNRSRLPPRPCHQTGTIDTRLALTTDAAFFVMTGHPNSMRRAPLTDPAVALDSFRERPSCPREHRCGITWILSLRTDRTKTFRTIDMARPAAIVVLLLQ